MSNRYKKYFENITPDQSLMDDTIRKMQEELKSDKKAVIFDIRPVAAIAACVAVTASAVIFSPGLKKPDISDPHDQAVENVTETTANTDDDSVSASSDTSAENNTTETNITEITAAASESVPSESDSSVYSTGRNEASGEKTTDRKPESTVKTSASAVPSVQHSKKPASSPAPVTKPAVTEKEQPQDPALKPEFTTALTTSAACTVTPTPPPVMSPTKGPGYDNSGSSPNSPSTSYPSDKTDTAPTMAPTAAPTKAPAWPTIAPTASPTKSPTASPTMSPTAAPGISGGEPDTSTGNRDYIRKDVNGYTVLINYADSFINDFPSDRTEITYEYSSEIFGRDFLPRELKKQITSGYSNAHDDTYSCGMVFSIGNESSLLSGSRFINIGVSETYSPYGYLPCCNGYGYMERSYIAGKETVFSTLPDVSDVYFCDVYTDRFQYRFTFKGYSLEEVVDIIEKL